MVGLDKWKERLGEQICWLTLSDASITSSALHIER